jgi:hypothetical protein
MLASTMPRYLLSCECGKLVPVEAGEAGGRAACECGKVLDVPTLRHLRHLPSERAEPVSTPSGWNVRFGIVATCLIVAVLLSGVALAVWLSEPRPVSFDPLAEQAAMTKGIDSLTPSQAWERWAYYYRPLAELGWATPQVRLRPADLHRLEQKRFLEKALLVPAAVFAAAALTVALWPKKKTRKNRGSETRR